MTESTTYDATKRISSPSTRLHKFLFPIAWYGGLSILMATIGLAAYRKGAIPIPVIIVLAAVIVVMLVVGRLIGKHLIYDLVDEVYDGGDYLLVRGRGLEERVPFTQIINVGANTTTSPPRVSLRLAKPGRFGDEISFMPLGRRGLKLFARLPLVDDLIVRVDRARARRID